MRNLFKSVGFRSGAAAAAALCTALTVGACGGSSSTPTAASAPNTAIATAVPSPAATPTPLPATATPLPTVAAPKRGGILQMRVSSDTWTRPQLWNTYASTGSFTTLVTQNLLSNLTYLDPLDGSTIRPDTAQSWEISKDAMTITYHLRPNVAWYDGQPFTAQDVVFNLNRAARPSDPKENAHVINLAGIASVTAPDPQTVVVQLNQPEVFIPTYLSIPTMLLYPAHIASFANWATNPVGTGPFKLKGNDPTAYTELVRNDRYYKRDGSGNSLPYLDGIRFTLIPDQGLGFSAFRTGKLDCACGLGTDIEANQLDLIRMEQPDVRFAQSAAVPDFLMFGPRAPFDNVKVRQAISVGLDRQTLTKVLRGGIGIFPPTFFVPADQGGKLSLPTAELLNTPGFRSDHNLDRAASEQLWKASGVDPSSLRITVMHVQSQQDKSEAYASVLSAMGIRAQAQTLPATARNEAWASGNFDMSYQVGSVQFDDPGTLIGPSVATGSALNYMKYSNPEVDRVLKEQKATVDAAKRQALIYQLQRLLIQDAQFVPGVLIPVVVAAHPYVQNVVLKRAFNNSSALRFDTAYLSK